MLLTTVGWHSLVEINESDVEFNFNYMNIPERCLKQKHKFRQNKFGVVWCVDCGLLSNQTNAQLLDPKEIRIFLYKK